MAYGKAFGASSPKRGATGARGDFEERVVQIRRLAKVVKGGKQLPPFSQARFVIVGTGVTAGGAVRVVLGLAGVENALGKQIGSENFLNNARAIVQAISVMKTFAQMSIDKNIPMEELWK